MFITEYDEAATMDKFLKEGISIGFEQGNRQGTALGDHSRLIADAKGMYEKGLSPSDIADIQKVDVTFILTILGLENQDGA